VHLPTDVLQHLLTTYGYVAVLLFVALEGTGVPIPGETMLLTAAAYAGAGHLQIPFVIGAAIAGAVIGDNLGYTLGWKGLRSLVLRFGRYIRLHERHLLAAERFYVKHGDKTVFFGRFVAIVRTYNAFLAGINRMHWPKFFAFDAAGAVTWATLYGLLAFTLGRNFSVLERLLRYVGIVGAAVIVLAGVGLYLVRRRAVRRSLRDETGEPPEDAIAT
jgi:membrane protein DedA with SNARE-associated domain